jgi:hypothetical protein
MGTLLSVAIQNKNLANRCADRFEALAEAVRQVTTSQ